MPKLPRRPGYDPQNPLSNEQLEKYASKYGKHPGTQHPGYKETCSHCGVSGRVSMGALVNNLTRGFESQKLSVFSVAKAHEVTGTLAAALAPLVTYFRMKGLSVVEGHVPTARPGQASPLQLAALAAQPEAPERESVTREKLRKAEVEIEYLKHVLTTSAPNGCSFNHIPGHDKVSCGLCRAIADALDPKRPVGQWVRDSATEVARAQANKQGAPK